MMRIITALVLLSVAIGCGDDDDNNGNVITVRPGESIQAAVDGAAPGSRIEVMPGDYVEMHNGQAAVLVEKSLELVARNEGGEVRILPGPGNTEGIYVLGTEDNFIEDILIKGFTIDGFEENGIWTFYVRNFEISENNVGNADHVGIYPQLSAQGLVRDNIAFGGLDSAMWVSGSEDIRVIDNEVHGAPIGLQVNVSKNIDVEALTAFNNVVGVAFTHPLASGLGDDVDLAFGYRSETARFADGDVRENNLPNPIEGDSGLAALPSGTGILIIGHDRAYVEDNMFVDNDYAGLVLVDHCAVTGDTDEDCVPDENTIVRNTITGNGTNPPDTPFADLASDVIVFGPGEDNCMADNTYETDFGAAAVEAESCPPFNGG